MTEPKPKDQYQTVSKQEIDDANEMIGANESENTIFRVVKNKDNPYVMIDKRPIENPALSWKAKGLLAYLLSRPDNWIVRMGDLIKRSQDGEFATRGAAKELESAGHIAKHQERKDGARFAEVVYTVYEQPLRGNPHAENPHAENLALTNIDSTKKDSTNTSGAKQKHAAKATNIEQAIFSGQPVTADMLETEDGQFENAVKDTAFLICMNNAHLAPLARAFMMTRRILLDTDKKKQTGHRKALKEMYEAKPVGVRGEHVEKATRQLMNATGKDGHPFVITNLFHIVETAKNIANEMPEDESAPKVRLLN